MGRDIQAIKITGEDRRLYRDKVRRSLDAFARMLRERWFDDNPSMVGQEIRSPARTGACTGTRSGARWTRSPACCESAGSTTTPRWWARRSS